MVSSESASPVAVTGGVFHTALGENVDISAAEYVASVESNGQAKTVVGKTDFDAAVQSLKSGETINIQVVPENSTLTIPEGVTVTNKTNNSIVVNGSALNARRKYHNSTRTARTYSRTQKTYLTETRNLHQTQKITIT